MGLLVCDGTHIGGDIIAVFRTLASYPTPVDLKGELSPTERCPPARLSLALSFSEYQKYPSICYSISLLTGMYALVVVFVRDHTARLWDVASQRCRQTFRGHVDSVNAVAWQPFTNNLCTGSGDKTVSLWDARSGLCMQVGERREYSSRARGSGDWHSAGSLSYFFTCSNRIMQVKGEGCCGKSLFEWQPSPAFAAWCA